MKQPSLKKRMEQALEEVGSDPRFARDLLKSMVARGITFKVNRAQCNCFPRELEPKKTKYGSYLCRQCGRYIDADADRRALTNARVLVMPVADMK